MVYAAPAVAIAVLALKAASTLAVPIEISEDLITRDFDGYEVEARDVDVQFDARDFDVEEIVERAPTTTSTRATPTTTTTTVTSTPTGKNQKPTKTVVISVNKAAPKCTPPTKLQRLTQSLKKNRNRLDHLRENKPYLKHSQLRQAAKVRRIKKELRAEAIKSSKKAARRRKLTAARANAKASTSSTTSTTSATATATGTTTAAANKATITSNPLKFVAPKGAKVSQKKKVGKDGVTTIHRTITAAPTACPISSSSRKGRRSLDDVEDLMEREYFYDELD